MTRGVFYAFIALTLGLLPAGVAAASIDLSYTTEQIRERVSSGLKKKISLAQARHDLFYGLWRRGSRPLTYKILSSQLFYYRVFDAYFSDVARAANLDFRLVGEPGDRPDVLVVMDYKLTSWDSVGDFLKTRDEVGFEDKLNPVKSVAFNGCTADVFHKDGWASNALIVINIAHPAKAVKACLYTLAFQLFGFSPAPDPTKYREAMDLDLAIVAGLYRLQGDELNSDKIQQALFDKLGLK